MARVKIPPGALLSPPTKPMLDLERELALVEEALGEARVSIRSAELSVSEIHKKVEAV